jgi:hypothetical protein
MKTIRTILATFGVTSAAYGLFALIAMRLNPAFTGRSIYQLFRDTGFVALVLGIGCVLSFVIMTIAIVSFRDDGGKKKRESEEDDLFDDFLEEETVPEERADEADESWSPEIKRKQRKALRHADEEPTPDLFADDEDEPDEHVIRFPETAEKDEDAAFRPARPVREPEAPEEPEEPEEAAEAEEPEMPQAEPGTKRCIYCGETIDADSAFCIHCGKRV